ncbi:hypothetical protein J2X97_000925 [Epilithonimonas hungarica]|uniref:hypothetical protein n=1 Tax=Epilithonimonas hungarica TaxID=454006 RepID=UPI0027864CFB|nr:hypothetical protein [Epilithonimonas hungarica]MDP9955288.1 hypothetical protein [Epilithonimonas hungarica]
MKKFISILAIAVITTSFISCRQEDETADLQESVTQQNINLRKTGDSAQVGTVTNATTSAAAAPELDPDPPVRDGTRW